MTARAPRIVATIVLGLPSAAAIYGSAANLVVIAGEQHLSDPRVLPFCLDILAIGIVVTTVFCGHDDRLSRITPWLAYGSSAVLQVTEVWPAGPRAWAVHALPLAAAILGTETILRLWRPEPAPDAPPVAAQNLAAATLAPVEAPATPALTPAPRRTSPARRPRTRHPRPSTRPADVDLELVAAVRAVAADLGITPAELSRDRFLEVHRSSGGTASAPRAGAALNYARENPHEPAPT